jgi:hypothetical protein
MTQPNTTNKGLIKRSNLSIDDGSFPVYETTTSPCFFFVSRSDIQTFMGAYVAHPEETKKLDRYERFNLGEAVLWSHQDVFPRLNANSVFFSIPGALKFFALIRNTKDMNPKGEKLQRALERAYPTATNLPTTLAQSLSQQLVAKSAVAPKPSSSSNSTSGSTTLPANSALGKRPRPDSTGETEVFKLRHRVFPTSPNYSFPVCPDSQSVSQVRKLIKKVNDKVKSAVVKTWLDWQKENPEEVNLVCRFFGNPAIPSTFNPESNLETCALWTDCKEALVRYLDPDITTFPGDPPSEEDQRSLALFAADLLLSHKSVPLEGNRRDRYELIATGRLDSLHRTDSTQ